MVLLALADIADDNGGNCYPNQDFLAKKSRMSVRHLRRAIETLEKAGEIKRLTKRGRYGRTEYRIRTVWDGSDIPNQNPKPEESIPDICDTIGPVIPDILSGMTDSIEEPEENKGIGMKNSSPVKKSLNRPETVEEAQEYFRKRSSTDKSATSFFDYWESIKLARCGSWVKKGRRIGDWKALARIWVRREKEQAEIAMIDEAYREAKEAKKSQVYQEDIPPPWDWQWCLKEYLGDHPNIRQKPSENWGDVAYWLRGEIVNMSKQVNEHGK